MFVRSLLLFCHCPLESGLLASCGKPSKRRKKRRYSIWSQNMTSQNRICKKCRAQRLKNGSTSHKNPPRQKWRSVITSCRERGPQHCINATLLHNAYTVLAKGGGIFWTSRSPKPPREWGNFTISHIVMKSFKLDVSNQHLPNMASPWGQPRSTWLRLGSSLDPLGATLV